MTRVLAVLRPEPGNAATVARARAAGFDTLSLPLFAVQPLDWTPPDPAAHDALLLTSANAMRFGGPGLAALRGLPVLAVGEHTAAAARAAGFPVAMTGDSDAAALVERARTSGIAHALHLTGRDRLLAVGGPISVVLPVYENAVVAIDPAGLAKLRGTTALLHSARAARRLGDLIDAAGPARAEIAVAAFSPAIAASAGPGWRAIAVAATPDDAALFAALGSVSSR